MKKTICRINPDLVVLQEVKTEVIDRGFVASIWSSRFKEWVVLPAIGRSGGCSYLGCQKFKNKRVSAWGFFNLCFS